MRPRKADAMKRVMILRVTESLPARLRRVAAAHGHGVRGVAALARAGILSHLQREERRLKLSAPGQAGTISNKQTKKGRTS